MSVSFFSLVHFLLLQLMNYKLAHLLETPDKEKQKQDLGLWRYGIKKKTHLDVTIELENLST